MLSRVADALYWMGRYLERAEHTTRLLLVTDDLATEIQGIDAELAENEWKDLLEIFPGSRLTEVGFRGRGPTGLPYLVSFFTEETNPYSALFSLRKARENARLVREALTVEVFVNLNDTYHVLETQAKRGVTDVAGFRAALASAQKGLLSVVGAIEHTLTRDQAWLFLKLGEMLERTGRSALILRAKLPGLIAAESKTDLPLYYTRWRSLLRDLAALENYRATYGARMEKELVLQFVLFQDDVPHSLRHGASAAKDYLARLPRTEELSAPERIMGRLASRLSYEDSDVMRRGDFSPFLKSVLDDLERAHEAIATQYFVT